MAGHLPSPGSLIPSGLNNQGIRESEPANRCYAGLRNVVSWTNPVTNHGWNSFRHLRQPILLQAAVERAAAQAQRFGGAIRVAFKAGQGFRNQ